MISTGIILHRQIADAKAVVLTIVAAAVQYDTLHNGHDINTRDTSVYLYSAARTTQSRLRLTRYCSSLIERRHLHSGSHFPVFAQDELGDWISNGGKGLRSPVQLKRRKLSNLSFPPRQIVFGVAGQDIKLMHHAPGWRTALECWKPADSATGHVQERVSRHCW